MVRVLVVDDNETNLDLIERRLSKRGFVVVVARNGEEGIAAAKRDVPDLILMDMSMPVMSGWDATRELKAFPATSHIPIIALTAHAMVHERELALEQGCDEFVSKPVEFQRLLAALQKLLGDKMPPQAVPAATVSQP